MSPEEIAGRSFAVVRRGFEPESVRRFLEEVAGIVRQARAREMDLQTRLADAEQRAASPVLDEAVLSAALGAETARVLKVAHEAAQEVVHKAEERAEALLEEASTVHTTRAAAAEAEAAQVLEEAERAAEEIVERTKAECRSMLEQARDARRRMLDDLARRRRDLHGQIEQLRAAKDALSGIFGDAATAVAEIQARLGGAEDEAREAAGEVAHQLHGDTGAGTTLDAASLGLEAPAPASPGAGATTVLADFGDELGAFDEEADEAALEAELAAILPRAGSGRETEGAAEKEVVPVEPPGVADEVPELADEAPGSSENPERSGEAGEPASADEPVETPPAPGPGDSDEVADAPDEPGAATGGVGLTAQGPAPAAREPALEAPATAGAEVAEAPPAERGVELFDQLAGDEQVVAAPAGEVTEAESGPDAVAAPGASAPVGEVSSASATAKEATAEAPSNGRPPSAVDALFARIRASRAVEVAKAKGVLGVEPDAEEETATAGPLVEETGGHVADNAAAHEQGDDGEETETATDEASLAEGAAAALRRDEALEPVRIEIARALKRVLRSQQNELLDAARTVKVAEAETLLSGDETAERIAEAAEPALAAAWQAGRTYVGDDGASMVDGAGASDLAIELAVEVVGAIDGRLREGIASLEASGAGQEDGLGELVGVAYRDWKGARIDTVAADAALRAFAAGSVAGARAAGVKLRWLVESGQPCADCDDNALSGPLEPGEAFPTGQSQPPLHAGCRCVLVAVPG